LADRAATAFEIARLQAIEIRERSRLSVLARTGRMMQLSLDRDRILHALGELPIPWLADFSGVLSVDGERLFPVEATHADTRKEPGLIDAFRMLDLSSEDPHPVCQAWRTERVVVARADELPKQGAAN